ncbi:MAG: uroporphyrinogen decarboxylase family protein [Fimbriimonadaceae bacterium]
MSGFDVDAFWSEEPRCRGRAFSTDKPRCPISLSLDDHWLLDELRPASVQPYFRDPDVRAELHRRANERCASEIGIRPFSEAVEPPGPLRLERVLGCPEEIHEGGTPWLGPAVSDPGALSRLLDAVESWTDSDLLERALVGNRVVAPAAGPAAAWTRGPATMATSVVGTTELMYLVVDEPDLAERLFAVLGQTIVRYHRVLAEAAGSEVRGCGILDDNCALFSRPMYDRFCLPAVRTVLDSLAAEPGDMRFQHSDSDMGHLMPSLATLGLTGCNFGPRIPAADIRACLPRTEIYGQVAPMTLRSGERDAIFGEVRRDFAAVGAGGGWTVATAGSIPAGTSLESVRTFLEAVGSETRYDAQSP